MGKIDLSVVIPAYNEHVNLKRGVLSWVWDYLKQQDYSWEVLIVDDGSTDDTKKLVDNFIQKHQGFTMLKEPHRGKGGTVIAGMNRAKGKIILFADMDQATPIDQIGKILPLFKKNFDIVIGSRKGREGASIVRKVMAYGFSLLRNMILRLPYRDTQCGFKAFKRNAAKKIFKRMKIFSDSMETKGASVTAGFDLEIMYLARKLNMKVAEVPVEWFEYGERKEVSSIKDSWEGFRDLLKVRINALMGRYRL